MGRTVKPGEVWKIPYGNAGATRDALILNVSKNGEYCSYLLCHLYQKEKSNIRLVTNGAECYIDPLKVSFDHTSNLAAYSRDIAPQILASIRSAAAKSAIGVDPTAPDDVEQRLNSALASVESMKGKIAELQHQIAVYKEIFDRGVGALVERLCANEKPDEQEGKPPEKPERKTPTQKEINRQTLLPLQSYIGVKCKEIGMTYATLDRLTGHVAADGKGGTGAVSHWVQGDSPAHWDELERIFPGLKAEAEAWVREQKAGGCSDNG